MYIDKTKIESIVTFNDSWQGNKIYRISKKTRARCVILKFGAKQFWDSFEATKRLVLKQQNYKAILEWRNYRAVLEKFWAIKFWRYFRTTKFCSNFGAEQLWNHFGAEKFWSTKIVKRKEFRVILVRFWSNF